MHKRPDRILVIIQSRLSSKRLKNKMLLPFGGSCLFEIAVKKLANLSSVPKSSLYVSVHDTKFVEIARKYGINVASNKEKICNKLYLYADSTLRDLGLNTIFFCSKYIMGMNMK